MKAEVLKVAEVSADDITGLVIAQDLPKPRGEKGYAFRKGQVLRAADLETLRDLDRAEVHAIHVEADDIDENEAGMRLARALAGEGLTLKGPAQSRVNLVATHRGLLEIDVDTLHRINCLDGMSIFTLHHEQPVIEEETVAGAKVAPLVIAEATVQAAEQMARSIPGGVVRVRPFQPVKIAVLYREKLAAAARERFGQAVQQKAAWFGSTVTAIVPVSEEIDEITRTLAGFARDGAGLIFAAGGSSTDPLDATIVALERAGAHIVRRGVPAHPGSMFWLAYLEDIPVLSLASCSLFSQATVVDVVLPKVLTGQEITPAYLAAIGHGGLMDHGPNFRFPPYARTDIKGS